MPKPLSTRIGKYEVEAEIGSSSGGRVRVFRALDRDTGRPVTLKLLADVTDKRRGDRFRREVACVAKLRHPNVVAVYELGEHVGLPFAAIEHLGDHDLSAAIRSQQQLTLLQKLLTVSQVVDGVRAVHRCGLAHLGLRPSAIALDSDGSATIHEFGVVRLSGGERDDVGRYAAPEEFTTGFVADSLCDVFAFGVVCYEFLTGGHPFRGDGASETMISILHREPSPLRDLVPECPEALERLVHRSLEKRRELRYQNFDDIRDETALIVQEVKRSQANTLWTDSRRMVGEPESDKPQRVTREPLQFPSDHDNGQPMGTELRGLLQTRTARSRVEGLWRRADEEASARRFSRAVEILRSALQLDTDSPETRDRVDRMTEQLEQVERAVQLVAEAQSLVDNQSFNEAHDKVLEALERDSQSEEANQLLTVITGAIERREREAKVEKELEKAKSMLLLESFEPALAILAALRAESPDPWLIDQWIAHVQAQQRESHRQSRVQDVARETESLLAQQRYSDAAALLDAADREFPDAWLLTDLRTRTREALENSEAISKVLAQSVQLRQDEQFEEALGVLDAALRTYPAETALVAARRELEAQQQNSKQAAAVRQALDEVQWLLDQDRPDLAVRFLRERSAVAANDPRLASRLDDIEKSLPEWEQRRFLHVIQDYCLSRVAALEQLEQWPVALTVLDEALVACPASGEMMEAAERLRRRLQDQEKRKKVARRVEAIEQKIAAKAWTDALSLIESAHKDFPGEPQLEALTEKVHQARRRADLDTTVSEVRLHLTEGETDQADQVLRKAMKSRTSEPTLLALQDELSASKKYRDEWRKAQVLVGRRQFAEAEQMLVRLVAPDRPEVRILLDMVREARSASDEKDFYKRRREEALRLLQQGSREQAVELLHKLLVLYPQDPVLEKDLQSVHSGDVDERRPLLEQERRSVEQERRPLEQERRSVEQERRSLEQERRILELERRSLEHERRSVEPERRSVPHERRSVEPERRPIEPERRPIEPERRPVEPERRGVEQEWLPTENSAIDVTFVAVPEPSEARPFGELVPNLVWPAPVARKLVVVVGLSLAVVAGIALWTVSSWRAPAPTEAATRSPAAAHPAESQVAKAALPSAFDEAPKPSPSSPSRSERSLERPLDPLSSPRFADSTPLRRAFVPPPSRPPDSGGPPTSIPAPPGLVPTSGGAGLSSGVQALVEAVSPGASPTAPPRPVEVTIAPPEPARVGGKSQELRLISSPRPVYPAFAKEQHVSGAVALEATVDKQGAVTQVNALRGHPYLVRAAKDAVLKWRYQPAMLNGQPIEAKVTITINFETK
ncbi:MAG: TonB family protein [Acidobacteriota bacterium]|nr:TonB family protein [Acidobacteriota bacterium]